MSYRLSILDKSPRDRGANGPAALAATLAYADLADRLGYHRFWLAEHHGSEGLASAAPEVLAAHLAARTRHLRIGTGGVLLQHYSPFKVAEVFSVLTALAPGRIDLGIGKAPGGLPRATRALQAELGPRRDFAEKLIDLDRLLRGAHPEARVEPPVARLPELFLLGGSAESARLAGRLGWGFVHAGHHDGEAGGIDRSLTAHAAAAIPGTGPAILAVAAHAAPTRAEAEAAVAEHAVYRLELPDGQAVNLPSPEAAEAYAAELGASDFAIHRRAPRVLAGTAEDIHAALAALRRDHDVQEFILDNPVAEPEARLRSLDLIAGARRRAAA